jgi:alpha-beta hydrolase superfamily lysophospholipase
MKTSLNQTITEDGLVLHGVLYEPNEGTDIVLVHVHGMGGNFYENKFLEFIAKTLTDNGIAFCPFNNRGNGHITDFAREKDGKKDFVTYGSSGEKFEDCLLDIQAHIDFVKEKGYKNIHLSGHSLGAPKVAYFASQTNEELKSVIFMSPSDMLGLARKEKEQFEKEITEAKSLVEAKKENEFLSNYVWGDYPIKAKTYLNLFNDDSKASIFNFYEKERGFETLSKINKPTLALMGKKDDVLVIPIEDIMETIKTEMKNSPNVKTEIIGDANHGYQDHEQMLSDVMLSWIKGN